jgi:hypothetical protein
MRRKLAFLLKSGEGFSLERSEYDKMFHLVDPLQKNGLLEVNEQNGKIFLAVTTIGKVLVEEIIHAYIFPTGSQIQLIEIV